MHSNTQFIETLFVPALQDVGFEEVFWCRPMLLSSVSMPNKIRGYRNKLPFAEPCASAVDVAVVHMRCPAVLGE